MATLALIKGRFPQLLSWKDLPTWLCVMTPWVLIVVGLSLALHVRLGLGHWPNPVVEHYTTPAFQTHLWGFRASFVFALYSLAPVWMLLLCAQRFRVSVWFHAIQVAVYIGGWLVIFLVCWTDPWRFMSWLAD